ncbi:hypothetical protein D3C80_1420410 [compost metagenome]
MAADLTAQPRVYNMEACRLEWARVPGSNLEAISTGNSGYTSIRCLNTTTCLTSLGEQLGVRLRSRQIEGQHTPDEHGQNTRLYLLMQNLPALARRHQGDPRT